MKKTLSETTPDIEKQEDLSELIEQWADTFEKAGESTIAEKIKEINPADIADKETFHQLKNLAQDQQGELYLETFRDEITDTLGIQSNNFPIEKYKDLKKTEIAAEMAEHAVYKENIRPVDKGTKQEQTQYYKYNKDTGIWQRFHENRLDRLCKKLTQGEIIFNDYLKNTFQANLKAHEEFTRLQEMGTEPHELPILNGEKLDLSDLSDIKNLEKSSITKNDYALHRANVQYKPEATCPEFKKFVNFMLDGNQKQVKTLQEFMGWLLKFPDRTYKKALLILGVSNSGKSQLLEIIELMFKKELGDSITNLSLTQLANDRNKNAHKLTTAIANLDKDLSGSELENPAALKLLISQEQVEASPLYEKARKEQPTAKFVTASNVAPNIESQTDDAFIGRFLTLKAPNSVPKEDREKDKGRQLFREEKEGIFMWMLEGLKRLEENEHFTLEPEPFETKMSWMEFGDDAKRFIWQKCEVTQNDEDAIAKEDLYEHYKNWVRSKLVDRSPKNVFKRKVSDTIGVTAAQANQTDADNNAGVFPGDRIFRGIKVKENEIRETEKENKDEE